MRVTARSPSRTACARLRDPVTAERAGGLVAADQHRRQEPSHDVDRVRLEERAGELRATLDEGRLDAPLGERARGRLAPSGRSVGERDDLDARILELGDAIPRCVRPDGQVDGNARSAPRTSAESSGSRANESNTTRTGWRTGPAIPRAVSCGSSASAVPMPTTTASWSARSR